jgi:hypothetical protein
MKKINLVSCGSNIVMSNMLAAMPNMTRVTMLDDHG